MKCKIEDCEKEAMYKAAQVCQKHYFRYMRNGTYHLLGTRTHLGPISRRYRTQNPAGYYSVYEPDHFLSWANGYVYEHRKVYFDEIEKSPAKCLLCLNEINWKSLHIDHIDNDVTNNKSNNLRPLCRSCNVFRGHTNDSMGTFILSINGKTMSASAWARQPGSKVCCSTIRYRKRKGYSDYDAVYGEKVTHKNSSPKTYKKKYDSVRGI